MAWIQRLRDWLQPGRTTRLKQVAAVIAERSQPLVWPRVVGRALSMRPAEAAGYFRARAASVLHAQIDRTLSIGGQTAGAERQTLFDLAAAELSRRLMRQWIQARAVQSLAPPRKAA